MAWVGGLDWEGERGTWLECGHVVGTRPETVTGITGTGPRAGVDDVWHHLPCQKPRFRHRPLRQNNVRSQMRYFSASHRVIPHYLPCRCHCPRESHWHPGPFQNEAVRPFPLPLLSNVCTSYAGSGTKPSPETQKESIVIFNSRQWPHIWTLSRLKSPATPFRVTWNKASKLCTIGPLRGESTGYKKRLRKTFLWHDVIRGRGWVFCLETRCKIKLVWRWHSN